jgi:hypothetical protein
MEKFMLIFHSDFSQLKNQSPEEMQSHMGKWMAWVEKLKQNGQYLSGEPLLPGGKLVKGVKGGKSVTDGPYTEGKEVVGGFFIVQAKDYNEVLEITKDYPEYELGGAIQIRQVMKMEVPEPVR